MVRVRSRAALGALDAEVKIRFLGSYLVLFGLGLLIVFAIVHTHVRMNDLRFQVRELKTERQQLENEHNELLARVQELSRPERLGTLAKTELGMVLPTDQRVALLFLRDPVAEANREAVRQAQRQPGWLDRFLAVFGKEPAVPERS